MSDALFDIGPDARGMGKHESHASGTTTWLTPPHVLDALGPFDLDPCACPLPRPWPTAATMWTREDGPLMRLWEGRVWLNPPYGTGITDPWMRRLGEHGTGTALIFARTETSLFFETVWDRATSMLFLKGRLHFHRQNGTRAAAPAGAPSVLIAYGMEDDFRLKHCGLPGRYVRLSA